MLQQSEANILMTLCHSRLSRTCYGCAHRGHAAEVESGMHFEHFIVPAIQGGAGTSINMNVNEIIANRALNLTGHKPGEYEIY